MKIELGRMPKAMRADARRLLRLLIKRPGLYADEVARALRIPLGRASDAVAALGKLGLVGPS